MNISARNISFGSIYVNVPFQEEKKNFRPLRKKLEQHPNVEIKRDEYNVLDNFIIRSTHKNESSIVKALHRIGFNYRTKGIKVDLGDLLFQRVTENPDKVIKELKLK